jgi:uncharacterized protein (TIGR02246 family)
MDSDAPGDVGAVGDIVRRIESAENAGDSDDIAEMMADDAVIMVPNQPVQEGKSACVGFVREVLSGLLEEFNRRIAYVSAEVRVVGDFAFDRGSFSVTVSPRSGGDTTQETGKYLFLYSRDADRLWKIARAIVNLDDRDGESAETT